MNGSFADESASRGDGRPGGDDRLCGLDDELLEQLLEATDAGSFPAPLPAPRRRRRPPSAGRCGGTRRRGRRRRPVPIHTEPTEPGLGRSRLVRAPSHQSSRRRRHADVRLRHRRRRGDGQASRRPPRHGFADAVEAWHHDPQLEALPPADASRPRRSRSLAVTTAGGERNHGRRRRIRRHGRRRQALHHETPELNGRPGARGSTRRGQSHRGPGCRPTGAAGRPPDTTPNDVEPASPGTPAATETQPQSAPTSSPPPELAPSEPTLHRPHHLANDPHPPKLLRPSQCPPAHRNTPLDHRVLIPADPPQHAAGPPSSDPRRPTATRRRATRPARLISSRRPV